METDSPVDFLDNGTSLPFVNDTRPRPCNLTFTHTEFVGYFLVQPIICVVGVILNLINVFVFLRGKQFSGSPTYRLMMILSVFDALTLMLTFPQSFVRCKNYLSLCENENLKNIRYAIFRWHVYVGMFLVNTSEGVSIWMTVLLSVERYISIKHHYIIKAHFSTSNVHKITFFIIMICVVINVPLCFVQSLYPIYKNITSENFTNDYFTYDNATVGLTSNITFLQAPEQKFGGYIGKLSAFGSSRYYQAYSWMRIVFFNFIPLIFLSCVNAFLIYIVRSSGHFRKHSSQTRSGEKRMKAQRNLTILLVTIIFLFLTGQIPLAFAYVQVYQVVANCSYGCCAFYQHYRMITAVICLITYATNFFIYQTLNKHFRAEIYRLCRWFQMHNQRAGTTSEVLGAEAVAMVTRRNHHEVGPAKVEDPHLNVGNGEVEMPSVSEMPRDQ